MPERRTPGTGSLRLRPDGRWQCTLELQRDQATGRRRRWFAYGKTRREVSLKLADARRLQLTGKPVQPERQTVATFLRAWLRDVVAIQRPASTQRNYAVQVHKHIVPALGHLHLGDVRTPHLQGLYAARLRAGAAPASVRQIHAVLHAAFAYALDCELLDRNPADRAKPPRQRSAPRPTFSDRQAVKLLQVAESDPLRAFWWLALTYGMRLGEILRLRWGDLDLRAEVLQIRESKTGRGRAVPLVSPILEEMQAHRLRLEASGISPHPELPVFPSSTGRPLKADTVRARWYKLVAQARLPRIHVHDTRHTAVTLLLSLGVPPHEVAAIVGHATPGMTMAVYAHASPQVQRHGLQKLGALLSGPAKDNGADGDLGS